MRSNIEEYLTSLESYIQKRLHNEESKIKRRVESLRSNLCLQKDSAEKMSQELTLIRDVATEHQIVFALPELEKALNIHKEKINLLTNGNEISKQKLSLKIPKMENIKKHLFYVLCNLSITDFPFDVTLKVPRQNKLQQRMTPIIPMAGNSLNGIVLKLNQKINLKHNIGGNVEGCAISPMGNVYMTCSKTRTLYMYVIKSKIFRKISKIRHEPFGVAVSSDGNRIFISSNTDNVTSIDISVGGNETTISMKCNDVDYLDGNIFGSSYALRKIFWGKPENPTTNEIPVDMDLYSITVNRSAIFCTNFKDNTDVSFGYDGRCKWQYKNFKLKSPIGITSTSSGVVFVTCKSSDNVHAISADGKDHRIILSQTDGMDCPRAINFHRERNQLVVINEYKAEMFLYDVVL